MNTIQTAHVAQHIGAVQRVPMPLGMTVAEIAAALHRSVEGLTAWVRAPAGHATEWIEIPRHMWRLVKPKLNDAICFGYRPQRGVLRSVFQVIASVVAIIAVPLLAPVLGTIGASLAGAAIGIGASLAANLLFPTATPVSAAAPLSQPQEAARAFSNVESDSNLLAKEAYLPIICGERRISPPEIASPHFFMESGIQSVDRIFAADGHHSLTAHRVDGAPVDEFPTITTEVRDGQETTPVTTFVDKITNTTAINETLSGFTVEDQYVLVDQERPENSLPRWIRFATAYDPAMEEIAIRLRVDNLAPTDTADGKLRYPMRIRFREKGSAGAWYNLPEIHLAGRDLNSSIKVIRLRWDSSFGASDPSAEIFYEFCQKVPESPFVLSDGTTGLQWQAHSHFVDGPGTNLRDTVNILGRRNGVHVTLDETQFPKAEYEFEIIGGLVRKYLNPIVTYFIDGNVRSRFVAGYENSRWESGGEEASNASRITVSQATVIVDRDPCLRPKTALLAIRSKGQSIRNVTTLAKRYVYDWDGAGWNTLTTTKNPATHYRQILFDYLTYHGIDTALIANDDFVAWRTECINRGYEVSATFAGAAIGEVLDGIAIAGFARKRVSDGFGIDWFRDRSAERPVQTFSPRNATVSIRWNSPERPIGIRAKFENENDDYRPDELEINNPLYANFSGYEVLPYETIANPALIERRAYFDLLQGHYQGRRLWTVDAAIEGLICERGDMVGVVTDLLNDSNSGARIREVINSTNLRIDQEIPTEGTESLFDVANIFDPANIFDVGEQSVCLISTPTGTEQKTIIGAEDNVIRLDSALSSTDVAGAHIVIGPTSRFTHRCIVLDRSPQNEERATLTLIDEAPEIFEKMQERYG